MNPYSQLLEVRPIAPGSFQALLTAYEVNGSERKELLAAVPVVLGRGGVAADKAEGDGKTPKGLFGLGEAFGYRPAPAETRIPYRQVTKRDYWVDDPASDDYNRWVRYEGNPSERWSSYEALTHKLYSHAIIVKYNMNPIVKGRGSAIFIHEWENADRPTAGCVAMAYEHLAALLQIVELSGNPHILILE